MIEKKNIKNFGNVSHIKVNITKPITMNFDAHVNKINLYVGPNGVGKSLILKLIWLLQCFASLKLMSITNKELNIDLLMQEFIDKTFSDNDFTGEMEIIAPGGSVKIECDNGKITYSLIDIAPSIKEIPFPTYMSTITRTFEQIEKFIKLEKDLGQIKVFEYYKMYDVIFCSMIKQKYSNGIVLTKEYKESFKKFDLDKHEIESVIYKNDNFLFINKKGEEKKLTSLSSGEQSLINMLLAHN